MKKSIIYGAILLLTSFCCYSQKPFSFLNRQGKLHVVFNYDKLVIQGLPENDYLEWLEMRNPKAVDQWENAKATLFGEGFTFHLNKNINTNRIRLLCGEYPDALYQATVYVRNVSRNYEKITFEVVFTRKVNNELFATIKTTGKSRGYGGIRAGSYTYKARTAFNHAGQNLGKIIASKI